MNSNQNKKQKSTKNNQARAPVPGARAKPKKVFSTALEAAENTYVPLSPDSPEYQYCESAGLCVVPIPTYDRISSLHPISHAIRACMETVAIRAVLSLLCALGVSPAIATCLDVWGKPRRGAHTFWWGLHGDHVGVQMTAWSPIGSLYPGDIAKGLGSTLLPVVRPLFALFRDIYGGPEGYISAETVASICAFTSSKMCAFVTHEYAEPFGAHLFSYDSVVQEGEKTKRVRVTKAEGVWTTVYRKQEAWISFCPEEGAPCYPPHKQSDWRLSGGVMTSQGFLHVTAVASHSTFRGYVCALSDIPVVQPEQPRFGTPTRFVCERPEWWKPAVVRGTWVLDVVERGVARVSGMQSAPAIEPGRPLRYVRIGDADVSIRDRELENRLRSMSTLKVTGGLVLHALVATAHGVGADLLVQRIEKHCPGFTHCIVTNALLAVTTGDQDGDLLAAIDRYRSGSQLTDSMKIAINKTAPRASPEGRNGWWWGFASLGVLASFAISPRIRAVARAAWSGAAMVDLNLVGDKIVLAPLIEETMRSFSPGLMLVAAGAEAAYSAAQGLNPVPALLVHVGLNYSGWAWSTRVLAHAAFNFVALLTQTGSFNIQLPVSTGGSIWWLAPLAVAGVAIAARWMGAASSWKSVVVRDATGCDEESDDATAEAWLDAYSEGRFVYSTECCAGVFPLPGRLRSFEPTCGVPEHLSWGAEMSSMLIAGERVGLVDALRHLPPLDCECQHLGMCAHCLALSPMEFIYPLAITNACMFKPANTLRAKVLLLLNRVLIDPTPEHEHATLASSKLLWERQKLLLAPAQDILIEGAQLTGEEVSEELLMKRMRGVARRRYREAKPQVDEGQFSAKKPFSLKINEVLPKLKGRIIVPVDPQQSVVQQGFVYDLATRVKETVLCLGKLWTVRTHTGKTVSFHMVYPHTSGSVLSALMTEAEHAEFPVIFMSNDDLFCMNHGAQDAPLFGQGTLFWIRDIAKWDLNQSMPFFEGSGRFLEASGFPQHVIDEIVNTPSAPIKTSCTSKFVVRGVPQMSTGTATTHLLGQLHHCQIVLAAAYWEVSYEAMFEKLGMPPPTGLDTDSRFDCDFLKGVPLRNLEGGLTWTNLPPVNKIGKTCLDPNLIAPSVPAEHRHVVVLAAVCESFRRYPRNMPIVASYFDMVDRLALASGYGHVVADLRASVKGDRNITEDYAFKPFSDGPTVTEEECFDFLDHRYGIMPCDARNCERMLDSYNGPLPALFSHFVFARMREVDYPAE